jgi:hypothetical protein
MEKFQERIYRGVLGFLTGEGLFWAIALVVIVALAVWGGRHPNPNSQGF